MFVGRNSELRSCSPRDTAVASELKPRPFLRRNKIQHDAEDLHKLAIFLSRAIRERPMDTGHLTFPRELMVHGILY